jgi:hypothetical protein
LRRILAGITYAGRRAVLEGTQLPEVVARLLPKYQLKTIRRETKAMDNKKKYDNNGIYATEDLIELFWGLLKEGYTGLGFGLILDLIEDRVEDQRQLKEEGDNN